MKSKEARTGGVMMKRKKLRLVIAAAQSIAIAGAVFYVLHFQLASDSSMSFRLACEALGLQEKAIVDIQRGLLSVNATTNVYSSDSLYSMISDNTFGMYPITPSKYPYFIKIRNLVNSIYLRSNPYINESMFFQPKGQPSALAQSRSFLCKANTNRTKIGRYQRAPPFTLTLSWPCLGKALGCLS
jgi:hypothetical protein